MRSYWPLEVALAVLIVLCPTVTITENSDFFSVPATCASDSDCQTIHTHAVCIQYMDVTNNSDVSGANMAGDAGNETMTTASPPQMRRCRCNSDYGYHVRDNTCVKPVEIRAECEPGGTTVCMDQNARCVSDGSNTNRFRCSCQTGYVDVDVEGQLLCAEVLTKKDDTNCTRCEHNEGTCYDLDGDSVRDGCVCPNTRTGSDCETANAIVLCDVDKFQMIVCYQHESANSADGVRLHVTGRDDDELCKGHLVAANDTHCVENSIKLVLDLHDPHRQRCGTREIKNIPNALKFENTLTAAPEGPVISSKNSQTFTAFCGFATRAETFFQGVNVNGIPGNDRGQHKRADLLLQVENNVGNPIPTGVAVYLGDRIRLVITVIEDGTFSALRVEQCTASSSPTIPDPKAVVMPLTVDGCPAQKQFILTAANSWRSKGGEANVVQTGYLNMFKMRRGSSVYIHCAVKLCLKGAEGECGPVMCTNGAPHFAMGRKRRAAAEPETMTVSRQLTWFDPEENANQNAAQKSASVTNTDGNVVMSASGFSALMVVLVSILVVFVILTSLLIMRLRRVAPNTTIDSIPEKPQRFALPRITRNTFRI